MDKEKIIQLLLNDPFVCLMNIDNDRSMWFRGKDNFTVFEEQGEENPAVEVYRGRDFEVAIKVFMKGDE